MERRICGLLIVVGDSKTRVRYRAYKAASTRASVTIVTLMQMRSELMRFTSTNTLLNPDPFRPLDHLHHH